MSEEEILLRILKYQMVKRMGLYNDLKYYSEDYILYLKFLVNKLLKCWENFYSSTFIYITGKTNWKSKAPSGNVNL